MGRATILSGGDAGLYTVRVDYGTAQRDAAVTKLTARIAELTTTLAGLQATLDAFVAEEETPAVDAVNAAIDEYVTASRAEPLDDAVLKAKLAAHQVAVRALFDIRQRAALLRIRIKEVESEKIAAEKASAKWTALVLEEDRPAWCVDYTTDGAGTVATIDIPGESDAILIRAGAPAPAAGDGALTAREIQTGPQAFFNAAILPGWQKFKPLHRVGVITSIDSMANAVGLSLEPAQSSAQALDINQSSALSNVPVQYMTCNSRAFLNGDRVVIEFIDQDVEQPVVIGFESNPRPCNMIYASAEYWQYILDTNIISIHAFTVLIDLDTMSIKDAWDVDGVNPYGVTTYNQQPYLEMPPFFALMDATGSNENLSVSPPVISLCQHSDKFYGLIPTPGPGGFVEIVEFAVAGGLSELRRWAAAPGPGAVYTMSAHGGQLAVCGAIYDGIIFTDDYFFRIYNIATKAIVAEMSVGESPILSVDMSKDFLAVLHWGPGSGSGGGWFVNMYRRNPYVLLNSQLLNVYPESICIIGNKLIGKEEGDVWVWEINPATGVLTYLETMRPFDGLASALPGKPGSHIRGDGSSSVGHMICAVAKG